MKGTWQGQESICQPVSLKSNLVSLAHRPADRFQASSGLFHVFYNYPSKLVSIELLYSPFTS